MTSARIGDSPNTIGHYPGGALSDRYREATSRMTGSTSTFTCACCGQFKSLIGRTCHGKDGRRQLYKCAQCTADLAKAWAQLEFEIAKRGRAAVPLENINQAWALLGLK